jgi:heterodisulfide reductase subunit C2
MEPAAQVETSVQRPRRLENARPVSDVLDKAAVVDIAQCLQCGKCSGGCSVAEVTDYSPRKIVQMVRIGAEQTLLRMDILSCCVGCGLCAERCPVGIDAGALIDALRAKAADRGIPRSRPDVDTFDDLFLQAIYRQGRVAEVPLMVRFNLKTRQFFKDANVGWRLLRQGKIRMEPARVKDRKSVRGLFSEGAGR